MKHVMKFMDTAHLFEDAWKLYKKYALRKLSELEVDKLQAEVGVIYKTYQTPFAKELLATVVGEIERSVKHYER